MRETAWRIVAIGLVIADLLRELGYDPVKP